MSFGWEQHRNVVSNRLLAAAKFEVAVLKQQCERVHVAVDEAFEGHRGQKHVMAALQLVCLKLAIQQIR